MLKYLKQAQETFIPALSQSPTRSDADTSPSTSPDAAQNSSAKHDVGVLGRLPRPGNGACAGPGPAATNKDRKRDRCFGFSTSNDVALLPCAPSVIFGPASLSQVKRHIASLPAEFKDAAMLELAGNLREIPEEMRETVFYDLGMEVPRISSEHRSEYLCSLASSIEALPHEGMRNAFWAKLADALMTMPAQIVLEPTIALIDAISHVKDHEVRGDHLGLLIPLIIAADAEGRNRMTDHLIRALPHVAPGEDRRNAIEQIFLLVRSEPHAARHLCLLLEQTHHFTSADFIGENGESKNFKTRDFKPEDLTIKDNLIDLLEKVTERSVHLPDAQRLEVLMAIPQQFGRWPVGAALKAAVLMIGRHTQSASVHIREKLGSAIGEGLSDALGNLLHQLSQKDVPTHTWGGVDAWLEAAAFSSHPARGGVLKAASCLVKFVWRTNDPARYTIMWRYGVSFSAAELNQLKSELDIVD
ncbi:MAG: hypothetical protein V4695_07660 [Pseudomonadota bacterium]